MGINPPFFCGPSAHGCFAETAPLLLEGGYTPIPLNGKKPTVRNWNKFTPYSIDLDYLIRQFPEKNVGILTGEVLVIDIDILDNADAHRMAATALEIIGWTELIRIGKEPKRALLYRTEQPRQKQTIGEVEILGKGQQLAVYGIHPDTGKPYHWPLESLIDCPLHQLPLAEEDNIRSFVAEAAQRQRLPQTQRRNELTKSGRNTRLFSFARDAAQKTTCIESFRESVIARNATETDPKGPLDEKEVEEIVQSVWKYKTEGSLYKAGQQFVMLPMGKHGIIHAQNAPKSIDLLAMLRATRKVEDCFTIPQSKTARNLKCGTDTLRAAIEYLIEHGYIECVWQDTSSNARRKPHRYCFKADTQPLY